MPVQSREFGDLSDVFYSEDGKVKINPGSGNFDAHEAAVNGHLRAELIQGGGLRYFLTKAYFEEHLPQKVNTRAMTSKAIQHAAYVVRLQQEKEVGYEELHELTQKLGLGERSEIIKKEPGIYKLLIRSKDNRTIVDATVLGTWKELQVKLKNLSKVFSLLKALDLEDRYKLIDSSPKQGYPKFILYMFPEKSAEGMHIPEHQFEGDAVALYTSLKKTYESSRRYPGDHREEEV